MYCGGVTTRWVTINIVTQTHIKVSGGAGKLIIWAITVCAF